jgi:outer membrane protein assembly factor BamB
MVLALHAIATPAAAQAPRPSDVPAGLDRGAFAFFPLQGVWTDPVNERPTAPIGTNGEHFAVPFATGELWLVEVATGRRIARRPFPTTFAPVFAGPNLLVTGDGVIDALRSTDLEDRWRRPLPAKVAFAPVARSGWAFVALADGAVLGLRTDTGAIVWTAPGVAAPTVAPCVEGDRLYTGGADGQLHARDAGTGADVWSVPLDGNVTALAAVEGHVFAATASRFLYALDARRGQVRWRFRIAGTAIGLAVDEDRVIAVMLDQSARAFKIGSGAQVWRRPLSFRPAGGPVVAGGSVLVTGFAPNVRVLDRRTGELQGTYAVPLPPDSGGIALETLYGGPVFQHGATVFDDVLILITQQGWIHGTRRLFEPPAAPLAALPGEALPAPAPPPGWVPPPASPVDQPATPAAGAPTPAATPPAPAAPGTTAPAPPPPTPPPPKPPLRS